MVSIFGWMACLVPNRGPNQDTKRTKGRSKRFLEDPPLQWNGTPLVIGLTCVMLAEK